MSAAPISATESLEHALESVVFSRDELRRVSHLARACVASGRRLSHSEQEHVSLALLSALARLNGSRT